MRSKPRPCKIAPEDPGGSAAGIAGGDQPTGLHRGHGAIVEKGERDLALGVDILDV